MSLKLLCDENIPNIIVNLLQEDSFDVVRVTPTITDKSVIQNQFVTKQSHASFQQGWEWGEYEQAIGREVVRFGVYERDELISAASFFKLALPVAGHYWYCPRGPVISDGNRDEILKHIIETAKKLGQKSGAVFVRFSPDWTEGSELFEKLECIRPRILLRRTEPDVTWLTNLEPGEDKLLSAMHEKTRYNIRLAERKGVTVADQGSFGEFWSLMQETAARQRIGLYPRKFYEELIKNFEFRISNFESNSNDKFSKPLIKLFMANLGSWPSAAALVIGFGDTVTYLYGGSTNAHREVMAPHLLHWRIMQWAKKKEYRWYDWWGVAPKNPNVKIQMSNQFQSSNVKYVAGLPWLGVRDVKPVTPMLHPWEKLSRFKRGFGGEEYQTIGTWDLILRPLWYKVLQVLKNLRA